MSRNAPFRGRQRRRVPKSKGRSPIWRSMAGYRSHRAKIRFGHSRVPNKRKIVIKPSMMRTLGSKY